MSCLIVSWAPRSGGELPVLGGMGAETHSVGLQLHRRASKHQEVSALDPVLPTALTQAHDLTQARSSGVGCGGGRACLR